MDQIEQIVIMDNGANTIKVGYCHEDNPRIIPNCITKVKNEKRRPFIADQMDECKDCSGMFYLLPFNRGYLLNWDIQRQIWDHVFRKILKLPADSKGHFSSVGILITEPVFNFPQLRKLMIKYLFEEYGFGAVLISNAPQLAAFRYIYEENKKPPQSKPHKEFACLVVESGYSFTHIVPFVEGYKILPHMKRIDVGGKVLTNHLKEIISYRQINVLDETYVVNQMKEDCCYVSKDFWNDLEMAKRKKENTIQRDYVLPDYINHKRGFVYDKERHKDLNSADMQMIRMNNERFQVPELLFHPSDVGLDQLGIPETIIYAVNEFNPGFRPPSISITPGQTTRERPENLKDIDSDEEDDEEEEEDDEEETESMEIDKKGSSTNVEKSNSKKTNQNQPMENGSATAIAEGDFSIYDDENIQAHLYNNILLIGGNCRFPNFRDRVYNELRHYAPDILDVRVYQTDDPITYGWHGGKLLCTLNENDGEESKSKDMKRLLFHKYAVSRKEYQQYGLNHCQKKFSNYRISL